MKKITIFLAAVLCAFGLTACGSEEVYSDYQQQKNTLAVAQAESVYYPVFKEIMISGMEDAEIRNYAQGFYDEQLELLKVQVDEDTYNYYVNVIPQYVDSYVSYIKDLNTIPWDEMTMPEVEETAIHYWATNYDNYGSKKIDDSFKVDGYGFYNAVTSFKSAGSVLGSPKEIGEETIKVDDDQIIITFPVVCEKGKATAEIIVSNDSFVKLKSASITQDFTMGQKMEKAALNTAVGISTVFVVLILICILISCFGIIPKIQKSIADSKAAKEAEKKAAEKSIDNAVNQIIANETVEESTDDTELVAVIAAAIAAYEGSASTEGYVVRSIRRRR